MKGPPLSLLQRRDFGFGYTRGTAPQFRPSPGRTRRRAHIDEIPSPALPRMLPPPPSTPKVLRSRSPTRGRRQSPRGRSGMQPTLGRVWKRTPQPDPCLGCWSDRIRVRLVQVVYFPPKRAKRALRGSRKARRSRERRQRAGSVIATHARDRVPRFEARWASGIIAANSTAAALRSPEPGENRTWTATREQLISKAAP